MKSIRNYTYYYDRSSLEWAFITRNISVARLLLARGAEVQHVDSRGLTPLFDLFQRSPPDGRPTSSKEYIEVLSAASFSDFDVQDQEGWSGTHRAAAFGTAEDISALTRMRASLTLQTTKLLWVPIFCAVQFGNVATFTELIKCHTTDLLVMTDVRKWTLLHVAVNAKRFEIMRVLISLGADPHAQSLATEFLVPENMKGLALTPGDISKLQGCDAFAAYIKALRGGGHELEVRSNDLYGEEDIFWPALEKV